MTTAVFLPLLALEATKVVKRYRAEDPPALDGLNLRLTPGDFFGLLGPNGAGKTTAFSLLSGLLPPDSGQIALQGLTYRAEASRIRRDLGVVPQELALYEPLTARENLAYFGRLIGLSGRRLKARVAHCLAIAQLEARADQPVRTYSTGMKRRLNLVVGLLGEPRMLFLDEPTVGIDAQSRHLIHQELRRLHQQGTTLLYTTHSMEEAETLCTRVAILDQGRVLQEGPPRELLQQAGCATLEELFLRLTGKHLRDD